MTRTVYYHRVRKHRRYSVRYRYDVDANVDVVTLPIRPKAGYTITVEESEGVGAYRIYGVTVNEDATLFYGELDSEGCSKSNLKRLPFEKQGRTVTVNGTPILKTVTGGLECYITRLHNLCKPE